MIKLDLPDGSWELLQVAKKNDKSRALANNYALIACYSFAERIVEISKLPSKRDSELLKFLKTDKAPANFLELTAACLRRISVRINEMLKKEDKSKIPVVSDFDGYALTALGLAFSELIWKDKDASLVGPPLEVCLKELGGQDKNTMYRYITKHYFGNIFQHYFEKAGIRREIKDLPDDEEILLRQEDALLLAECCFDVLNEDQKEDFNAFDFIESLQTVIYKIA